MRLIVRAIGKLPAHDPLANVLSDYQTRTDRACAGIGLSGLEIRELDASRITPAKRAKSEETFLTKDLSGTVVCLDERGQHLSSEKFAQFIGTHRDEGMREMNFLIGGADGHSKQMRARADKILALGTMTWPHMLARVMLAEQLYRATTILSGHPYHRA